MQSRQYTLKEFALNPSKVIHRVMTGEEDVTITLRGVPAVRIVPATGPEVQVAVEEVWAAMPGMSLPAGAMRLPRTRLKLRGNGPTAAEMLLEDRR
jgi:prevent-host-death family protein